MRKSAKSNFVTDIHTYIPWAIYRTFSLRGSKKKGFKLLMFDLVLFLAPRKGGICGDILVRWIEMKMNVFIYFHSLKFTKKLTNFKEENAALPNNLHQKIRGPSINPPIYSVNNHRSDRYSIFPDLLLFAFLSL